MEDINVKLIKLMGYQTYEREYHYREKCTIHTVYFDPKRPMNRRDNVPKRVPNYLTWEGFGKLWEWAIVQKWWPEFEAHQGLPKHWVPKKLVKPEFFAKAVADFLQEK